MSTTLESVRLLVSSPARYITRLARNPKDIRAAQVLRFEVFNLELQEGLVQSYMSGLDTDPFDAVCDHLLVEDLLNLMSKRSLRSTVRFAALRGGSTDRKELARQLRAEVMKLRELPLADLSGLAR